MSTRVVFSARSIETLCFPAPLQEESPNSLTVVKLWNPSSSFQRKPVNSGREGKTCDFLVDRSRFWMLCWNRSRANQTRLNSKECKDAKKDRQPSVATPDPRRLFLDHSTSTSALTDPTTPRLWRNDANPSDHSSKDLLAEAWAAGTPTHSGVRPVPRGTGLCLDPIARSAMLANVLVLAPTAAI